MTTATPHRHTIDRARLCRMLAFTRTHQWQAERSFNLDRVLAWHNVQDQLLDLWNQ